MELDIDALTLGDMATLERLSGRTMRWWIAFAASDDPASLIETSDDLTALLVVTKGLTPAETRGIKLSELFADG